MPDEIKESLDLIKSAILALDKKITEQSKRLDVLERNTGIKSAAGELSSVGPEINIVHDNSALKQEEFEKPKEINKENENKSFEENIGGTWFARIGIAALVLGVSFLLKYAFDNGWVGDTGKIIIGILIGLGLLVLGEKTIRKYFTYGQILTGGGLAVLYLSIFSAYNSYHLISSFGAFFVMSLITIVGILLSVRYDAYSLMMVATIGGFTTPIMASSGVNNEIGLLSYLVLLDLGILVTSIFKRWHWINVVGFFGTFILFSAWGEEYYTKSDLGITFFFLTIFFLVYSISAFIYNLSKKQISTGAEQLLTLMTAVVYFSASYDLFEHDYHAILGFFALVLAIYYFLWAFALRNFIAEDKKLYNFLAFLTIGFVTFAIGMQFGGNVITMLWAIEAVILTAVAVQVNKKAIMVLALFVYSLTIIRFLFIDAFDYNSQTILIFNKIFLTSLFVIFGSYAAGYFIRKNQGSEIGFDKSKLFAFFMVAANVLTIITFSNEIVQSFDRQITIQDSKNTIESRFADDKYYNDVLEKNSNNIDKLQNKKSISLSIFWLVYSIILLAVGIVRKYKGLRLGGFFLLMLAIMKLFFVDLWSLGSLYRIISSMTLGVVLLLISFVYQKYKAKLSEII